MSTTMTQFAEVARDLRLAQSRADALLREIRVAAQYLKDEHGYSLESFSHEKLTGLHRNTVMKLNSDKDWAPTPDTLEKLAELIVEADTLRAGGKGRITVKRRGRPPGDEATPPPVSIKRSRSAPRQKAAAPIRKRASGSRAS